MRFARAARIAATICVFLAPLAANADTVDQQRAQLQAQLADIQSQITQNQTQLAAQQKQRVSLERDLSILDSQMKKAQLEIKARNLSIQEINDDIADTKAGISHLDSRVSAGQQSLAEIIRQTRMYDDTSMIQLVMNGSLSDVFQEMDDFQKIQKALGSSFTQMRSQRDDLTARQQTLQEQQQEQSDLLAAQIAQQSSLKGIEKQKQDLVTAARGQESTYLQIIVNQQKSAAQIQAALFALRDTTKSVSFGDMYKYAKEASAKTGVRPAVILGILAEESNLGQNVGTGSWKTDMNPTRDGPVFLQICSSLGLDPDAQKVSKKAWYGWGGAMGPAQFIPSTWVLYKDRIANATGQNPPNPWDPRTATFATAILMMDNGADKQTAAAERLAALRYLAGWKNATKSSYAFYGDDVMGLAAKFQSQIDILGG